MLLKKSYPQVDGQHDPAITGQLVTPATSEFVQVINVGDHWACLSTIGIRTPGTIKIYDSTYIKPSTIAVEHACRMLHHIGKVITFISVKVQKQVGGSDCGLFALAYATDLCYGLDSAYQQYDQGKMCQHYVHCLENKNVTPFPNTDKPVPFHLDTETINVPNLI